MNPEDFAKAKEHFWELVDLSESERTRALTAIETQSSLIANEVRSLLNNHFSRTIIQSQVVTGRFGSDQNDIRNGPATTRPLAFSSNRWHRSFHLGFDRFVLDRNRRLGTSVRASSAFGSIQSVPTSDTFGAGAKCDSTVDRRGVTQSRILGKIHGSPQRCQGIGGGGETP